MSENLYLRIGNESIEWLVLNESTGEVRVRGQGDLNTFRDLVPTLLSLDHEADETSNNVGWQGNVYGLLRGEEVLLTRANVPSKQQRQVLRAVPYMIEEQLAVDVEHCHFAVGKRDSDGYIGVAVIDQDKMKRYLDLLVEMNIHLDYLGVDCLSVAQNDGSTIMIDGDRALIRSGESDGLCVPRDLIAMTVSLLPEEAQSTLTLSLHESEKEAAGLLISQLEAEHEQSVEVVEREFETFEALCRDMDRSSINLLQGEFNVASPKQSKAGPWKSVMILAACAFGVHLLVLLGQGFYFDQQASELDVSAKALYKEVFPRDRNVRDLRRRWKSHLSASNGNTNSDFLKLFSDSVKSIPGSPLTLKNVNFNANRGDLILQLETRRTDQLISFSESLGKLGLVAEIGNISQGDDIVKGSIKVRGRGGS